MPCTVSLPIRKATPSPPRPIAGNASRNSFTRAWHRSPKKTRVSYGRNQRSRHANLVYQRRERAMQRIMLSFLAFAFVLALAIPNSFRAQMQSPAPHLPRGTATDIGSAEVQALVQKTAADRVSDQAIRVVSVNGEYNVSIGVVHRAKTSGKDAPGGIAIQGGVSRKLAPGDVVIIPPNTPHWFSEITTGQIVYLVVRIDPHKILPAGYAAK